MIFYVNVNKISVDEQFELADMKSFHGVCPKLPWLRIPPPLPGGAMKFLQEARLMQIMYRSKDNFGRSCYQGTLSQRGIPHSNASHFTFPEPGPSRRGGVGGVTPP